MTTSSRAWPWCTVHKLQGATSPTTTPSTTFANHDSNPPRPPAQSTPSALPRAILLQLGRRLFVPLSADYPSLASCDPRARMAESLAPGGTRLTLAAEALQTARNVHEAFIRTQGRQRDCVMLQLIQDIGELVNILTALNDTTGGDDAKQHGPHKPTTDAATPTDLPFMESIHPFDNSTDGWIQNRNWRWPWWKFGLEPVDMFTTLHKKYNTYQAPLQDFEAFHHDVSELGVLAVDREDLNRRLAARQRQRFTEMVGAFGSLTSRITGNPACYDAAANGTGDAETLWTRGVAVFRSRSLDMIIRYFAELLPPEDNTSLIPPVDNKRDSVLEPPPLDNEADVSIVSTVEDSLSFNRDDSADDLSAIHPTILSNESPLRASPRSRHYNQHEQVFSKKPLKPIRLPSKPTVKTQTSRKRKAPDTEMQQTGKASTGSAPRYGLRSKQEKASAATDSVVPVQSKKRKQESTSTRPKRQRTT
ncbi:hypothetical protein MN608_11758 [Microdochium nivale]|nr:hypothetical protein MN608_11758 [Microdochium nivale]